ncbi:MAG TPA: LLM class flavin-dependent oxidoreductase, partial [Acidimicrobiales bacterium]|nr:LLM class flavin-dependent oxidoreductase [Acidimicrobiales bacterium]
GRLLPAFGLGVVDPAEQQAFGVPREERAARFDEALGLLRRLWREDAVDHDGRFFSFTGLTVRPKPVSAMDVWLGGRAPSELRRAGRLGDGWLPSFVTPAEAEAGRALVEAAATDADRAIDPEHFGALVLYQHGAGPLPARLAELVTRRRPGTDPAEVIPSGVAALRAQLARFVSVGFSKFVVMPATDPPAWDDELAELAAGVLPLQT